MSLDTIEVTSPTAELPPADARLPARGTRRIVGPAVIGLFTTAVSACGASRPSLWFDEAATITASTRSLPDLWRLLANVDAVHGLYYLLMHGWFTVFPVSEFWSRAPSCLAVGAAGAGVVVLAGQFSGRSVTVCAGIVFAVLPRTTWAGVEARSYAFTALAAVWLTILLVTALRRNRPWQWALYLAALTAAVVLHVFLVLLIAIHAAALPMLSPRRATIACWAVTTSIAAGLAIPFLFFIKTQAAQVAWIKPLSGNTVVEVLRDQYFDASTPFAITAGAVMAAAALLGLLRAAPPERGSGRLTGLTVAWIVIPTIALLLHSAFAAPIYYPRYLCFTAPAMALLLGVCLAKVAPTPTRAAATLLALTVAAAPNYVLSQRGPYKREGMDYSQVADVVTYHAKAGDCLLLDNTTSWKPGPIRPLLAARPAAYRNLVDVGRGEAATSTGKLWDGYVPIWDAQDRLRTCTVLWTVSERDRTLPAHDSGPALAPGPRLGAAPVYRVADQMGFRIVERWQFSFAQVTRSMRGQATVR